MKTSGCSGGMDGRRRAVAVSLACTALVLVCSALMAGAEGLRGTEENAVSSARAEKRDGVDGEPASPAGRSTRVVAHRAGAAAAPENTLAALERAVAAGADMAEIDVRMTGDGVLVVLHDDSLARTTGLNRRVWETDSETVRNLDAGSWYSGAFAGEGIPTLAEMLQEARGRIPLMIELKRSPGDGELTERAVEQIRAANMEGQCVLACADLSLLRQSKELAPALETVYIEGELEPEALELDYVDGYSIQSTALTAEAVERAHAADKKVYAWTVNSAAEIRAALDLGIDGVVTDDPAFALEQIADRASAVPAAQTG